MRILTKKIECGKYKFLVSVDRDIAVKGLEEFPDVAKYLFSKKDFVTDEKGGDDFVLSMIKSKRLSEFLEGEEKIDSLLPELIKFVFPFMLKKAGEDIDAQEILDYIYFNEIDELFNISLFEFLVQGFTQRGQDRKPRVKFSMK